VNRLPIITAAPLRKRCAVALAIALLLSLAGLAKAQSTAVPTSTRAHMAAQRVLPRLNPDLQAIGATQGDPILLRIFKREALLELWVQPAGQGDFHLFRSYPICRYSGRLGPKMREGDLQAPEGVYAVRARQLNPHSQYHLSFNLGYPNAYERAQGWTGSALMVHGSCVSIGCFAMTDPLIEEIYTLVAAALTAGQGSVPVHAFPFRLDAEALAARSDSAHFTFWTQLAAIYTAFNASHRLPRVRVDARGYQLQE